MFTDNSYWQGRHAIWEVWNDPELNQSKLLPAVEAFSKEVRNAEKYLNDIELPNYHGDPLSDDRRIFEARERESLCFKAIKHFADSIITDKDEKVAKVKTAAVIIFLRMVYWDVTDCESPLLDRNIFLRRELPTCFPTWQKLLNATFVDLHLSSFMRSLKGNDFESNESIFARQRQLEAQQAYEASPKGRLEAAQKELERLSNLKQEKEESLRSPDPLAELNQFSEAAISNLTNKKPESAIGQRTARSIVSILITNLGKFDKISRQDFEALIKRSDWASFSAEKELTEISKILKNLDDTKKEIISLGRQIKAINDQISQLTIEINGPLTPASTPAPAPAPAAPTLATLAVPAPKSAPAPASASKKTTNSETTIRSPRFTLPDPLADRRSRNRRVLSQLLALIVVGVIIRYCVKALWRTAKSVFSK